jgi:hypothetical protein
MYCGADAGTIDTCTLDLQWTLRLRLKQSKEFPMTRTIKLITRRSALRGGAACALASVVPFKVFGETILKGASHTSSSRGSTAASQADLYAFRSAHEGLTAIALTWPEETGQDCTIRIHAGTKTWEFGVSSDGISGPEQHGGFSVFIGNVAAPVKADLRVRKAVVMEVDARGIGQHGSSAIWAERMVRGSRQRIGTPFLTDILRDHEELAALYNRSSPDQDAAILAEPLSAAIAGRLRVAGSVASPESHARRLAYALLPDVLHYDPRRPAGFTFAAQNGRHPSELSDEVVHTILNGGISPRFLLAPRTSVPIFPYFKQLPTVG